MTLRAISTTLEIHCHPYHIQLGNPTLSPIGPPSPPLGLREPGWTILRVPFDQSTVTVQELKEWLEWWDDSALLFLRSVASMTLLDADGVEIRKLSVSRDVAEELAGKHNSDLPASRRKLQVSGGRSWLVYTQNVPTPNSIQRSDKATDETTPIAVALPIHSTEDGQIHAGLPVTRTRLPLSVNAQLEPITSRRDFVDNDWNKALVPPITQLWAKGALDLFGLDPQAAWQAMPLPSESDSTEDSAFTAQLEEAIIAKAREEVAARLALPVPGKGNVRLAELAVEAEPLEDILTGEETAHLAGLPAALPLEVRDQGGRWRKVLEDWRNAGAGIPAEVSVEQALHLVGDETRSAEATIALTAAGLQEGFGSHLKHFPCVVSEDGRHLIPPTADSPTAVSTQSSALADRLGIITLLHPAHLALGRAAGEVLQWLQSAGAVLDVSDSREVVRRLAAAGKADRRIQAPLTDPQVQALRDALESMDREEVRGLGPDIGRAVTLEAYEFVRKGRTRQRVTTTARPQDAYLPRQINREPDGFPIAASNSPRITWISERYAKVLRSPSGREGIGALRFLRLLGAEVSPRLRLHPLLEQRYSSESRLGLPVHVPQGPQDRVQSMRDMWGTYTLQDRDSPALEAVVQDILDTRQKKARRQRANALLATLAQQWDRHYAELSDVELARDNYSWQERGKVPAYWIFAARDIAWLDDESGRPRRPSELRIRTSANVAVHGEDSPDYLHPNLYRSTYRPVLAALGVGGDPSRSELISRLKQLRNDEGEGKLSPEEVRRESAVVYKALANSLSPIGGRTTAALDSLRRAFGDGGGLIRTDQGWLPPQWVFAGSPIFGKYGAFAPGIAETDALWRALRLRTPSFDDCVQVIRAVAYRRRELPQEDEIIMLETLRALEPFAALNLTAKARKALRELPLWTTCGWWRKRPVYATDDSVLTAGLRKSLPIWEPGGQLQQFRSLLSLLRVEVIDPSHANVVDSEQAVEHEESSELFRSALDQLQEDLARNDPQLARSGMVAWDTLREYRVYEHPSLALKVTVGSDGSEASYKCDVKATVDRNQRIVFVQNPHELSRVDSGGRAIATLFEGDSRSIAQAWRAAFDLAESGRQARILVLSDEHSRRERERLERELATRIAAVQDERTPTGKRRRPAALPPVTLPAGRDSEETSTNLQAPRGLVDPDMFVVAGTKVPPDVSVPPASQGPKGNPGLVEPRPGGAIPVGRSPAPPYTSEDRETVGMEFLRLLLSSDVDDIVDIRAQHGVGADAVDAVENLRNFYELKVHAGSEPDNVSLTAAEVQRARTTDRFILVVISDIVGSEAQPKARIIVDPLRQLRSTNSGSITLSGVHSAGTLTYFERVADPAPPSEEA